MRHRYLLILIPAILLGFTGCKDEDDSDAEALRSAAGNEEPVGLEDPEPRCEELDEAVGGRFCCEPGQALRGGIPPKNKAIRCEADGVRQGPERTFHPNGSRRWETLYHKGLEHGVRVAWYENGRKHYERGYRDGKQHGPWKEWSEATGQLLGEGTFDLGRKSETEIIYHENGGKKSLGAWLEGRRHGLWTEWRRSGKRKSETEYKYGVRYGSETWWHDNGQMWCRERYENGTRVGGREEWTPEGLPLTGPAVQ